MHAAEWSRRKAIQDRVASPPRGTILDRVLGPMDPDIANSFTEAQLLGLERVLSAPGSRRLPIDIRITVPFFRGGYFLTCIAGRERRSAVRLKEERAKHVLSTFANVGFFVFLVVLFVPTFIGLVHIFAIGN